MSIRVVRSALSAIMFAVLFAEVPTTAIEAQDTAALKVMSFNLRYGAANDGDDAWQYRKELVVSTIRDYGPDLLGTQETLPFQAKYISEHLPQYAYIGWSREQRSDGEQCGLLYLREKFKTVDAGQFWLSTDPDEKFSKSWDSSLPRVATWAILERRDVEGTKRLLFINTHFDHRGAEARHESAKLIASRLPKIAKGLPVVLTGDFNCDYDSEPYRALLASDLLVDTYHAAPPKGDESTGTFHGFKGVAGERRIDWILVSNTWEVTRATIDRTHDGSRYPSDHFPVTATIR